MNQLEVRLIQLEPARVAVAHGFGKNPEEIAWEKLLTWARANGQLDGPYHPRFFGFNNPGPSPASVEYGYEQWMTIGSDVQTGSDGIEIKEMPGGLFVVARFKGLDAISRMWQELMVWVEASDYETAPGQCLEELLSSPDAPMEEHVFDLYEPIRA
ncbi:MAG: GyrI-like domain-containing protein [Ardenticatenaceae bacterium]|nr:GyrI-like domain-containing protein [Anaerolineales bacterium]MCB8922047.1 GyrI-like domain-containing protein [Ardenticatenaceae bacterium]MCB8989623.1 GyrI-like domain-containing protein [Ardenticatenaceae bacterium]MCB9003164.1 GyrI-like domain-containing protein [Ardenticatenaceae bacterium]